MVGFLLLAGGGRSKPRPDDLPLFCWHYVCCTRHQSRQFTTSHHRSSSSPARHHFCREESAPRRTERERERERRKKDMKNAGSNYLIVVYCRLSLLAAGCGAFRSPSPASSTLTTTTTTTTTTAAAGGGHRRDLIIAPSSRSSSSSSSFSATVLRGKMWKRLEIEEGELLSCWVLRDFVILW